MGWIAAILKVVLEFLGSLVTAKEPEKKEVRHASPSVDVPDRHSVDLLPELGIRVPGGPDHRASRED